MERHVSMEEISDGRLYGLNDMVKADCGGCEGCHACCQGMGTSIQLDPLDVHRLCQGLGIGAGELFSGKAELNAAEGLILPNLKMAGSKEACLFLDERGRCLVHAFRPGICRIFPLGRYYEGDSFRYFLQVRECRKEPRLKVKVKKWIDTPELSENQRFIADWHYFLKGLSGSLSGAGEEIKKAASLYVLKTFYLEPYQAEGFYAQFYERLGRARAALGRLTGEMR